MVREAELQRMQIPKEHIKIEVKHNGRWVQVSEGELFAAQLAEGNGRNA